MGYLISSGNQREVAEEITQEVLSSVWQKSYQFDQKIAYVSTLVFSIARNKKIDRMRKNENQTYNTLDLIEALYPYNNNINKELDENIEKMQSMLNQYEKN